ncbi:glucosamine-6-phosphate deaminase [Flavitalea antarctica]
MTRITPITKLTAGKLKVKVYETRSAMGAEAAKDAAEQIRTLQGSREGLINIIFAAAPSQNEFLHHLSIQEGIDWNRINGFHMDEYVGLEQSSPQSFATFLRERIFDKLPPNQVYYINGSGSDTSGECERYARLLKENPVDIVCMGIGENTHIAFNDPHTADFNDPVLVKTVELDEASRQQQVHDGCFPNIDAVPTTAITLTVPALLNASTIFCMVPGKNKALAVYRTLYFDMKEMFPSTSLRNHPAATLYLDKDSAQRL